MKVTDSMMELYTGMLKNDGEKAIKWFINSTVATNVILSKYRKLLPIELLTGEEKKQLWDHVKSELPVKTKDELINACKIYYTIGTLA